MPGNDGVQFKASFFDKKIFYGYLIRFYKRMDFLVTVNPYFIERLAAYGVDPAKVTYIPNFVCDSTFYPLPEEKSLRMQYGLPTERSLWFVQVSSAQKGWL